jgi:hypothetical protein
MAGPSRYIRSEAAEIERRLRGLEKTIRETREPHIFASPRHCRWLG